MAEWAKRAIKDLPENVELPVLAVHRVILVKMVVLGQTANPALQENLVLQVQEVLWDLLDLPAYRANLEKWANQEVDHLIIILEIWLDVM